MKIKTMIGIAVVSISASAGIALAVSDGERMPVEFYPGHTHAEHGRAVGAPEHSGGTNAAGCHNGSVPYHCH